MTTGNKHWIIDSTRLAASSDFRDRLQTPLRDNQQSIMEKVYPDDGVFGDTRLDLAGIIDAFAITGTAEATDGDGHVIDLSQATDDGSNVPFENLAATLYYVGLEYVERPKGIQINPRTGEPEYIEQLEDVGVKADPDSVVDGGTTITFNVNTILESGVDHSGRQVAVYMKVPAEGATTEAVAIETLTVAYAAPNNTITTTGLLGQSSPVSTDTADYEVVLLGPTVKKNTDLRLVSGVVFIGIITGGGAGNLPSAFDTDDQNLIDVSLSGFNAALDAFITGVDVSVEDSTKPVTGSATTMIAAVERTHGVYYPGNGLIYVIGGLAPGGADSNVVQAYDPELDAWTAKTDVPSQSNGGAAADGRADGRLAVVGDTIYYMGGVDSVNGRVELVQRYKPDTDTWDTPAADLPAVRSGGYVGVINGKIYYAGGTQTGATGVDTNYEYDPGLDSWTAKATIDTSGFSPVMERGAMAVVNNKLYLIGGQTGGVFGRDKMFIYDPAVDTWVEGATIPEYDYSSNSGTTRLGAAAVVNGVIHLFGGTWLGLKTAADAHLMYNPELDEWVFPDPPNWGGALNHVAVADPDTGMIYLMGGRHNEQDASIGEVVDGRVAAFDASKIFLASSPGVASITGKRTAPVTQSPSALTWPFDVTKNIPVMPTTPRYAARAAVLDGRIYVFGGIDNAGSYAVAGDTLEMYCPETNTWTALADFTSGPPSFPIAWAGVVADEAHNLIWVLHGENAAGTERDEIWKYEVLQNDWLTANTTSSVFRSRGVAVIVDERIWYVGGIDSVAALQNTTHFYDQRFDVVTSGPTFGTAVSECGAVAIPNRLINESNGVLGDSVGYTIFLAGGDDGAGASQRLEWLDTTEMTWAADSTFWSLNRSGHTLEWVQDRETGVITLYAIGGWDTITPFTNAEGQRISGVFGPGGAGLPSITKARYGVATAEVNGMIYLFGGADDGTPTTAYDDAEAFGTYEMPDNKHLLENYSAQLPHDFANTRARLQRKRDNVGFRLNQIWGVGTWHPVDNIDYVKIGE